MRKSHLLGCVAGLVAALVLLRLSGGSLGAIGVLLAALACPLMMLVMMRFMMGEHSRGAHEAGAHEGAPVRADAAGMPDDVSTQ